MSLDDELDEALKGLGETFGLKGRELDTFVGGHEPRQREGFDGMVDTFRGMGLSDEGARVAAIGHHGGERGAREVFDTPDGNGGASALHAALDGLVEAYERFHGCTKAEAVRMAKGEAARIIVQHNLTAEAAAGRLREFAASLNSARPTAASASSSATAASGRRPVGVTSDPLPITAAVKAAHQARHRGLLREVREG